MPAIRASENAAILPLIGSHSGVSKSSEVERFLQDTLCRVQKRGESL